MFDGLSFDKLLIIGVIAVFLLGPTRLPIYAKKLAALIKRIRAYASDAQNRIRDEMGPDFDDVDWKKLDPRQYDPRRIIKEALLEDDDEADQVRSSIRPAPAAIAGAAGVATSVAEATDVHVGPAPFDAEAT